VINQFKDEYRFLSNFFITDVMFDGEIYPSSEHAYMAAKTTRDDVRAAIRDCASPAEAKKMGQTVGLRAGWDSMKFAIMHEILMDKFERNAIIRQKLIDTGDQQLVEGNWWGDKIWGVCLKTNQGQNHLGRALMTVRTHMQLRYAPEPEKRVIAVIGTAGRDKNIALAEKHWDFMAHTIYQELQPTDILVSGGAAWADHVAVWAYLNDHCAGLILHLPAPFKNNRFWGEYGTSGNACNYYHEKFSKTMGFNSLAHIQAALDKGARITEQSIAMGYAAMAKRNKLVANDCTHMVAFTFGEGDVPADGGTKITWDMAANKLRSHVSLARV
jgi:ribA/ribD-fused uncharacterized protein